MENPPNLPYPSLAPSVFYLRRDHAGKPVLQPVDVDDDEDETLISKPPPSDEDE